MAKRGIMPVKELRGSRILVVHQGAVGDLILALPAVKALRESLQPERLEIMGHPWTLPLADGRPYADAIIDINRAEMAPFFEEGAPLPAKMSGYFSAFDAAFCFSQSTTLAHNLRQAGIKKTFTLPSFPNARTHVIDHHLASLAALGIFALPAPPRIFLRDEERAWAQEFFLQKGWDHTAIIALHPGAGGRKKVWPPHRFAAVGRLLARQSKKLLIVQGPADEAAAREVLTGLVGTPHLLVHDVPLPKLAPLLTCASLFIGNDSGISHLAAALEVPTITIFGPTDPLVWAPRGKKAFWLQGKAACAPCGREKQRLCEQQQCLEGIEVEAVMAAVYDVMNLTPDAAFNQGRPTGIKQLAPLHGGAEEIAVPPP